MHTLRFSADSGAPMHTIANPGPDSIASFYDIFSERLIRDYVHGNRRLDYAVDTVRKYITPGMSRILDIGCGIGTSTACIATAAPTLTVDGADISPRNIECARALFGGPRTTFYVSDMSVPPTTDQYDLISLIDVYEHIPQSHRRTFDSTLAQCLTDDGFVVLTIPSAYHQHHLSVTSPSALQVVDEVIELPDLLTLAARLNGVIVHYQMVHIWNTHDYIHVVIARRPEYRPVLAPTAPPLSIGRRVIRKLRQIGSPSTSKTDLRRQHVRKALGVVVD